MQVKVTRSINGMNKLLGMSTRDQQLKDWKGMNIDLQQGRKLCRRWIISWLAKVGEI